MSLHRPIDTLLTYSDAISQDLITLSPFIVLTAVLKRPRNAVFIQSETLVLFCIAYVARYFPIFSLLFSLDYASEKLHLMGLFAATYVVLKYNNTVYVAPAPVKATEEQEALLTLDSDTEDAAEAEKLVTPCEERVSNPMDLNSDRTRGLRVHPLALVIPVIVSGVLSSLGEYTIVTHTYKYIYGLSKDSLYSDVAAQLLLFSCPIELMAIALQLARTLTFYGIGNANIMNNSPFRRTLTPAELANKPPVFVWAFAYVAGIGMTLRLPQLTQDAFGDQQKAEYTPVFQWSFASVVPFYLIATPLVVRFGKRMTERPVQK